MNDFFYTGENDRHFAECEEQAEGKKCICARIEERQANMSEEIGIEEALTSKSFTYSKEVGGVIAEALA